MASIELLYGSKIISTVRLKSAFDHAPVAPEDIHKTTIKTPVGAMLSPERHLAFQQAHKFFNGS